MGLIILAFGVAFSIKADLGTSPIASVSYVGSLFTSFSVGNITILVHSILILLQIMVLRRRYNPIQLLQLPVAIFFGNITDFSIWAIQAITFSTYWQQWVLCIIGIILNSIGVYLLVKANLVTLAAEGLVIAICKVLLIKFGSMKITLDITFVVIAGILSITFLNGIYGIGEGTIATAIFVGWITKGIDQIVGAVREKYSFQPDFE